MSKEEKVELLVLSTCIQCEALKKLLADHGVPFEFTEVDLMLKDERDELFAKMAPFNKKKALHVAYIGDKAIIGFQKELILKELGLADEC